MISNWISNATLCLAYISQQKFLYGNPTTKDKCGGIVYTTQQTFLLRAHYTTKVFNAATLREVVVSNLVALDALIVSYLILLLTNNNMMMISVRRMFKKNGKLKNYLSRRQRRQRQAKTQKGRSWAKGQSHIYASMTNILLILLEYSLLKTSYNSGSACHITINLTSRS